MSPPVHTRSELRRALRELIHDLVTGAAAAIATALLLGLMVLFGSLSLLLMLVVLRGFSEGATATTGSTFTEVIGIATIYAAVVRGSFEILKMHRISPSANAVASAFVGLIALVAVPVLVMTQA